ncbi:MAG TPA: ABC transporter ATP-binding protein [Polyangia bacterium]|nr:ABC transporter ATP-binding protein [Polyangia bacterium]
MSLLVVKDLCKRFGGLQAVGNVSFAVAPGSIKALIGPNGAGKTTLFNLIFGALLPDSGQVWFDGQNIDGWKPHQVAAVGMARTFQHIRLFPKMSAWENVAVGRHVHSRAGFLSGMLGLPWTRREQRAVREKALEIMRFLGVEDRAEVEATSLAYGQQRIIELGRALACEPKLLLLDEPAAGLNMRETGEMAKLIARIRDTGVTVLLVEHDMTLVMNISDEVLVLSYGETIADDKPLAIQKHPEVIKVYLGEDDA